MKEVKGFFKTLSEWWSNPRLKGVVQLSFWIVFFAILAIIFRTSKSSSNINKNTSENTTNINEEKNDEVVSYEFDYQYKDDTSTISIVGTHYDNKEKFTLNGTKFYSIDNIIYDEITNSQTTSNYAVEEWSYASIKNITDHNSYANQTKYKNGINRYEYSIAKEIYNNYYNTNYQNDIIITVTKNGDIINEATINYGFGIVNIKYTNINEIEDLNINVNIGE